MLAVQLKNYLSSVKDDANILIYSTKIGETRQLLMSDLDLYEGNIIIDAEYEPPVKVTVIKPEGKEGAGANES